MTALIRRLLLALLVMAFAVPAAAQQYPPRPTGPIYDGADMLSPAAEAALDAKLREYNATTGRALIVATVPDLGGSPIEPYATALFAERGRARHGPAAAGFPR